MTTSQLPDTHPGTDHTVTAPEPAAPAAKSSGRAARRFAGQVAFIVAEFVAAIGLWQLVVTLSDVSPQVVPGPHAVWDSLWSLIRSGFLLDAGVVTMQETLLGFGIGALLGIGLAVVMTEVPLLYRVLNPFVVAFQAMPKIAVAPLLLIWFGFGISSKVVLVVVMVFFPILVNTYTGLNSVRQEQLDLMRSCRASRWETFRRLRFYAALPFILASFEVSFVLALTAAVVAEILGSGTTVGLGTLLQLFNARIDMPGMFATVVVLSLLGMLLYGSVKLLSRYLLRWNQPHAD